MRNFRSFQKSKLVTFVNTCKKSEFLKIQTQNTKLFDEIWLNSLIRSGAKVCKTFSVVKSCVTSVYYLLALVGFDTAENGPLKVSQQLARS